jgi:glycosyltransferase involved in cell wall biosynthesis
MVQNRLCIVTHAFLPHVGGIEKVVYEQSKRLMQRQFAPFVVTNQLDTPQKYVVNGINVECYKSLNTGFRLGIPYPIPTVASTKVFMRTVKSSRLIHAHGHPYLSSLAAGKLAKLYGKPFVLTQHNTFIEYDNFFNTVERLNDLAIGTQTLKAADKIITVSKATKKYILSLGAKPQKIKVIHNGVDMEHFKLLKGKGEQIRQKLGISSKSTVALTVRRLVYKNGVDTLIETANIAVKKNPNLVFLAVGKGPDLEGVRARVAQLGIEKNFLLAGFVADEDLPAYYNAADLFVLPSKSGEGLPLVALEAMACGLPLVATDVGGVSEIMVDGFGKLAPANNPKRLAEAVLEFSNTDFSRRNELRAVVEEKFSWDRNVERLIEIYEELI